MKKVFCLILAVCLALPAMAEAAKKSKGKSAGTLRASDTLTTEEKKFYDGKSNVKLGSEKVFVSADLTKASFTKTSDCTKKLSIKYICLCKNVFKARPGRCPCGNSLIPAIKHGNGWFKLTRDDLGQLQIQPTCAADCCDSAMSERAACTCITNPAMCTVCPKTANP